MTPSTNSSHQQSQHFDIIIVGGGMVGLSVAIGLAEHYKIAVVDATELNPNFSKEVAVRVSAVTRASEKWLKELSAWQKIPKDRLSSYRQMKVWDEQGSGELNFSAQQVGEANLGHIIENSVLQAALLQASKPFQENGQICLFEKMAIDTIWVDSDRATLLLKQGEALTSQLIIAADGANSWVRKQLAFVVESEPYQQSALVALVETEKPHQRTAWQRFLSSGPLAFLPMKQSHLSSIVWSLDKELIEQHLASSADDFQFALEQAIQQKFGKIKLLSERFAFPLVARHATSYCQHRVVLVGDAAHNIHPLAGQGVNLRFKDAKMLVASVIKGATLGSDVGAKKYLRDYERSRKGDNLQVQKMMTLLKKGFGNEQQWFSFLRNQGMNLIDNGQLIKNTLMKTALDLND